MKPSDPLSVIQLSIPWDFAVVVYQKHRTTIQNSVPFVPDLTNMPFSTSVGTGHFFPLQNLFSIHQINIYVMPSSRAKYVAKNMHMWNCLTAMNFLVKDLLLRAFRKNELAARSALFVMLCMPRTVVAVSVLITKNAYIVCINVPPPKTDSFLFFR